jgi:hypothetical protein
VLSRNGFETEEITEFECTIRFPTGTLTFKGKHLRAAVELVRLIQPVEHFDALEITAQRAVLPSEAAAKELVITVKRPGNHGDTTFEMEYNDGREERRRKRIRLPGIHADIVLELMSKHPAGGEGVDMTVIDSGNRAVGTAEVEMTLEGVKHLVAALQEVAGL